MISLSYTFSFENYGLNLTIHKYKMDTPPSIVCFSGRNNLEMQNGMRTRDSKYFRDRISPMSDRIHSSQRGRTDTCRCHINASS